MLHWIPSGTLERSLFGAEIKTHITMTIMDLAELQRTQLN